MVWQLYWRLTILIPYVFVFTVLSEIPMNTLHGDREEVCYYLVVIRFLCLNSFKPFSQGPPAPHI